jgi:hypothetical protein
MRFRRSLTKRGAEKRSSDDVYFWPTPNGEKITILLEEAGIPYTSQAAAHTHSTATLKPTATVSATATVTVTATSNPSYCL